MGRRRRLRWFYIDMTITKKRDKYYCRFQINGERHHYLCSGASSVKEAEKIEAAMKYKIMQQQNGVIPREAKKKVSINKLKDLYIEYATANGNRSIKNALYYLDVIVAYFKGNTIASTLKPKNIEEFKMFLREQRNLKNASINRYLEILSKMFNLGIDNNLLVENPVKQVKKLLEDNHKIRFLTKEEETRLYSSLPIHLKPIVTTALQTGMRKSEILTLKWSNIDYEFGFIELLKTKSGKARKIPISDKLWEVLNNIKQTSEYVFINPETALPYVDIKRAFNTAVNNAKIENFRFHDLRHTVATRLVEKGIDILVVMEILGHDNIETTMRYSHPVPKRKSEAISVLNSYN